MQIVIDISEEDYKILKKRYELDNLFLNYYGKLIVHGTPLPKGHGRLIDADTLDKDCESSEYHEAITSWIDLAPTILEADNAEIEVKE